MNRYTWAMIVSFFICAIVIPFNGYPSDLVFTCGFEDWTGDANTTPDYCFGTDDRSYWNDHETSTEVVSSCGLWSPYTGDYFFYRNHYQGRASTCLSSTPGSVNDHGNLGKDYNYGHDSSFRMPTVFPSEGGQEIFFRFRVRFSPGYYQSNLNNSRTKFIRLYRTEGTESSYLMLANKPYSQAYWLFETSGYYSGDYQHRMSSNTSFSSLGIDFFDGEWHTISFWVKLQELVGVGAGHMKAWFDKSGNETSENADMDWDNAETGETSNQHFNRVCFAQNFGGTVPTESIAIGMDDIEIWDGIPNQEEPEDDSIGPPGDVTNFIAQPGDGQVVLSWVNPTDSDFKGTMIRYSTGSDNYPQIHTEGTLLCNK